MRDHKHLSTFTGASFLSFFLLLVFLGNFSSSIFSSFSSLACVLERREELCERRRRFLSPPRGAGGRCGGGEAELRLELADEGLGEGLPLAPYFHETGNLLGWGGVGEG